MVLWEITLATAYFLGLKRTYKLAVNLQRRLIPQQYPKIRQFAQGRTRAIFNVAIKVHRSIQERDLQIGRSLGTWLLRYLDKVNPTANVRGSPETKLLGLKNIHSNTTKIATDNLQKTREFLQRFQARTAEQRSSRKHIFSTARRTWWRSFPSIAMMIRPPSPAGNTTQYRQLFVNQSGMVAEKGYGGGMFQGGIRKDIRLWMQCT